MVRAPVGGRSRSGEPIAEGLGRKSRKVPMALFRRENPSASGSGAASDLPSPSPSSSSSSSSSAQRRRVTHVAAGSRVEGKLSGPTELLIEGEGHGEIQAESAAAGGG